MRRSVPAFIALAALLGSPAARAQASDPAAAQALFDDAKRLMAQGKYAEACPRFLSSFKLDPKPGASLNLAGCYEKNGQTASAWARYQEAASLAQRAGQAEREKVAREKVAELEPRLVRLRISAAPTPGLTITRDGEHVDATMMGIALPVDPGRHQIQASAPGKQPWSRTLDIPPGPGNVAVDIPALQDAAAGAPPAGPTPPPAGPVATPPVGGGPPPLPPDRGSSFPQKPIGFAAIGVGAAGLIAGAVLGGLALSKHSDLASKCPQGVCTNQQGEIDSFHALGNGSTGALVAGGVIAAAGVVLVATAPKSSAATHAWVRPVLGPAFTGLMGRF